MITHSRPTIDEVDLRAVRNALEGMHLADGKLRTQFEAGIAAVTGGSSVVATTSGTQAAVFCLKHLGISSGDEVIIPTYVCCQVREAVLSVGATPIYCDSGVNWNADRSAIRSVLSARTKAVILVNIYGIQNESEDLGVPVIEDHCQSLGVAPLRSVAGFYSFHATKCITTGVGGAAVFRETALVPSTVPQLSALSDIAAALGIAQLSRYSQMLERRAQIANRYFAELPGELTSCLRNLLSVYFRFPLRIVSQFERVRSAIESQGVCVRRGVDKLLHRDAGLHDYQFPNAVKHFNETLSIPIYPSLTDDEAGLVIQAVQSSWRNL